MLAAVRGMFECAANVVHLRCNPEAAAAGGHERTQAVRCTKAGPVGSKLPSRATRVLSVAVLVVAVLTAVASRSGTPSGVPGSRAVWFFTGTRPFHSGVGRRRRVASSGTVFDIVRSTQPPSGCGDGWPGSDAFRSNVMRVPSLRAKTRGHNMSGYTCTMPWPDREGCGMVAYAGAPWNSVHKCRECGGACPCNPDDGVCYEENMRGPGCGSACQDCHCVTLQEQRTETFLDQSVDGVGQTFRSTAEAGPGGSARRECRP